MSRMYEALRQAQQGIKFVSPQPQPENLQPEMGRLGRSADWKDWPERSPGAMRKKPANSLSDYWDIFLRRRWWIILPALVIACGTTAVVSKLPKIYLSQTTILVEPQKVPPDFVKPTVTTDVSNRLQIISQKILSRTHLQRIIDKFGLYRSKPRVVRILNALLHKGKHTPEEIIDAMRTDITVETIADEQDRNHALGAFKISYQGDDPALVQQVTRELAALFIEENEKVREQQAEGTTRFIDDELEKARLSLEDQERRRKDFEVAHMGSLPQQQTANLQLLGQLQTALQVNGEALARAQSQKIYEQSLLTMVTGVTAAATQEAEPPPRGLDVRREELARAQEEYTPLHPDLIELQAEVKKLEQQASSPRKPATKARADTLSNDLAPDRIRGQIAVLDDEIKRRTQQETEIAKRIEQMHARVEALPVVEQQMSELDRDYESSKTNYKLLLEKKNASAMAAEMEERAEGEQFQVVDPANYPEKPYKPDVAQLSLLGVLGGILCGCALGLFVEFQDRTIRGPQDAAFYLATPALASFPLLNHSSVKKGRAWRLPGACGRTTRASFAREADSEVPTMLPETPTASACHAPFVQSDKWPTVPERLVVAHGQLNDLDGAYAKEQFRMLRTRLVELRRAGPMRSILLTSAVPGEGKTWVSANLAFSMSRLQNLRVLLVDADLRGSGVSRFLGVNSPVGLSDYLVDGRDLNEVRVQLGTNLSMVPTIPLREGSAELLGGKRMTRFLEEALYEHELVVLDAPPVLALADAQVLTPLVDATIMVVRAGSSPYDLVLSAAQLLKPKTIGVVVNGVARLPAKSYFYYGSCQKSRGAE
jgi:polysaccharide chain length determinant protein (PEP-CTERM system associated)